MSTRRTKKPKVLGDSITKLLRNMGIEEKVKEYQAINEWSQIVGENVSKVTKAQNVVNGILFVKVKNSSWRNELIYMRQEILIKLDKTVGRGIIKEVRFI
ncbi:DUF721 domain-containing protein [candidate division KSB1 bacterium]|nr:DUF721 domain-containing protein [candidate division KSB1 bacterium]